MMQAFGELSNYRYLRFARMGPHFDGLGHKRGRRHLDFAACEVGRSTTNAD
jgi:hypothetical protein